MIGAVQDRFALTGPFQSRFLGLSGERRKLHLVVLGAGSVAAAGRGEPSLVLPASKHRRSALLTA